MLYKSIFKKCLFCFDFDKDLKLLIMFENNNKYSEFFYMFFDDDKIYI